MYIYICMAYYIYIICNIEGIMMFISIMIMMVSIIITGTRTIAIVMTMAMKTNMSITKVQILRPPPFCPSLRVAIRFPGAGDFEDLGARFP